jgi:hypothetical protein
MVPTRSGLEEIQKRWLASKEKDKHTWDFCDCPFIDSSVAKNSRLQIPY